MKIEHIAIWTKDIEKTKDFFVKYFGVKVGDFYENSKGFSSYFVSFDSGARLEIMNNIQINKPYEDTRLGYSHFAVSVGSKEIVNTLTETLRNDRYEVASEPRTTGDGYYESVILGPDNIRIEITE